MNSNNKYILVHLLSSKKLTDLYAFFYNPNTECIFLCYTLYNSTCTETEQTQKEPIQRVHYIIPRLLFKNLCRIPCVQKMGSEV